MMPKELGIILIIAVIIVAFIYGKMILIWRDVMLKKNEQTRKDIERLKYLKTLTNK
jgi:uncharacterized protein YhhL (DUF1145 family)